MIYKLILLTDELPFLLLEEAEHSQNQSSSYALWQDTVAHHLLNKEENMITSTVTLNAWKYTNDKPYFF